MKKMSDDPELWPEKFVVPTIKTVALPDRIPASLLEKLKKERNVFFISPVARISPETLEKNAVYVAKLENEGCKVHWPYRDTEQNDPTGGLKICRTNCDAIMHANEIHIWYDKTSSGSKFDMGGVFMLVEMLGWNKKIVIANDTEIVDDSPKSFYKVFKHLSNFKHRPPRRHINWKNKR